MNGEEKPLDLRVLGMAATLAEGVYKDDWESAAQVGAVPYGVHQVVMSGGDMIAHCPDNSPRSSILAEYIASMTPQVAMRLIRVAEASKRLSENLRISQGLAAANVTSVKINPGDVLIIRIAESEGPTTHDHFAELARNLSHHFPPGTPVLLTNDIDISALNEEAMRKAGWVKEPQWNPMSEAPPFPFSGDICLTNGRVIKNASWCSGYWTSTYKPSTFEARQVSHWRHPTPEPKKP
jgi:hypothetical protein